MCGCLTCGPAVQHQAPSRAIPSARAQVASMMPTVSQSSTTISRLIVYNLSAVPLVASLDESSLLLTRPHLPRLPPWCPRSAS